MSDENNENLGDKIKNEANEASNEAKGAFNDMKESWNETTKSTENKKIIAGILAIVLGAFGIHKFILGYNKEGIILLVASLIGVVTTCIIIGSFILMATGIVGLIEGIIYLTKSDEEFYETYQANKKPWF
tara:strand:+ start:15330 stop:15719 length:390 start_codon:yes stop_codon:yes gene_type:complete